MQNARTLKRRDKAHARKANRLYFRQELARRRASVMELVLRDTFIGKRGNEANQLNVRRAVLNQMRRNITAAVRRDIRNDGTTSRKELRQRRHAEVAHRMTIEAAELGLDIDGNPLP